MNDKNNQNNKFIKFFTYYVIIILIITIISSIPYIISILLNPLKYIKIIIGSILILLPSIIMAYILIKRKDKIYE
jgi:type IV secretory pathway TrbL component